MAAIDECRQQQEASGRFVDSPLCCLLACPEGAGVEADFHTRWVIKSVQKWEGGGSGWKNSVLRSWEFSPNSTNEGVPD